MNLNEIDIPVKNPNLLEVPAGKQVNQMSQQHFQNLINKKGYEKVIRGLTNLEVWNKNKNPELSKWASNMADKLKVANGKDESFSNKLDEANIKLKAIAKTKKALKGIGHYVKDTAAKSADTARNAIVAGAVAPVGAGIAQKYTQPKKGKDHKYTSAEVAALATAMKNRGASESISDKLFSRLNMLEEKKKSSVKTIAKSAATGTAVGGVTGAAGLGKVADVLTGGVKGTVQPGLSGKLIRGTRTAAKVLGGVRGAAAGLGAGTAVGIGKAIHNKNKSKNESLIEALCRLKTLVEEEGIPKKKRILTPEQKARRQERRRLRRQLQKQGIETTSKRRGGPVTTSSGVQKLDPEAVKKAQEKIAANKANPAPASTEKKAFVVKKNDSSKTTPSTSVKPVEVKKPEPQPVKKIEPQVKKSEPVKTAPKPAENNLSQKLSNASDKLKKTSDATKKAGKANKVFSKSSTLRGLVNKAGRVGALKGAAATAAVGAGLYGAKKLLDKNKRR